MYTLGIDLHKKSSVWILIDDTANELWKENVASHPDHITTAIKKLPVPPKDIRVAIEPVAGWRWVSEQLENSGMDVHIAHPRKVQLIAQSTKKTDTEDARTLANLLRSGYFPEAHRTPEEIYQLRTILRTRTFIVRARTGTKNQLHGISTTQGLQNIKGGNPLHKKGKEGIMAGNNFVLKQLHLHIEDLDKRIACFDEELQQRKREHPLADILMTMPGVGIITALTVIAEVDGFERFAGPKQLASFAGIVPRQRSSGEKVRYGSITHQGSEPLRTAVVETAMRIREGNAPELFEVVKDLTPRCGAKKARVALGRKILTILWKMATTNTPYDAAIFASARSAKVSNLDTGAGA
jgi:transposase